MDDHAFATLTPANDLAKLAFSDLYETLIAGRQNGQENAILSLRCMVVEPKQVYKNEMLRLRLETDRRATKEYNGDGDTTDSLPELDSDTEGHYKELGMIWVGHYSLNLQSPPHKPERGWTVGKGPREDVFDDLLLCTRSFAKWQNVHLRNPNARFNFFLDHKGFYVAGCSRSARVTVNGESAAGRRYHLNQHRMKIWMDVLEYGLQYTSFARTEDFQEERRAYVGNHLESSALGASLDVSFDMPTPLPDKRTIGQWTLAYPLGKGGQGRVFLGSNRAGERAAVKLVEQTSTNVSSVDLKFECTRK